MKTELIRWKLSLITAITVINRQKLGATMNPQQIASIVRHCRKQSGLSQLQLAKLAGIGKTAVFDLEKGKESIQLNTLLKVFDILNITIQLKTPFVDTEANNS
jgi:HTH-type transcriptional regulator/antitoxin HipB